MVAECFTRIIGAPLSDAATAQMRISIARGGMGLYGAADRGPAAHAASLSAARLLTQSLRAAGATGRDSGASIELPADLLPALREDGGWLRHSLPGGQIPGRGRLLGGGGRGAWRPLQTGVPA